MPNYILIKNNKRLKLSDSITLDTKLMFFESIHRCKVIYQGLGYNITPCNVLTSRGPIKTKSNNKIIFKLKNNIISKLFGFDEKTFIYPGRSSTVYGKFENFFPKIKKIGQFNNTEVCNIIGEMYKDLNSVFEHNPTRITDNSNIHDIFHNLLSCYIGTIEFEYYLESYTNLLNYLKYEITHGPSKTTSEKIKGKFREKICKIEYKMANFIFPDFFHINILVYTNKDDYKNNMDYIIDYIKKCRYILVDKYPKMLEPSNNMNACPLVELKKINTFKWRIGEVLKINGNENNKKDHDEYKKMRKRIKKMFSSNRNEIINIISINKILLSDECMKGVDEFLNKYNI